MMILMMMMDDTYCVRKLVIFRICQPSIHGYPTAYLLMVYLKHPRSLRSCGHDLPNDYHPCTANACDDILLLLQLMQLR